MDSGCRSRRQLSSTTSLPRRPYHDAPDLSIYDQLGDQAEAFNTEQTDASEQETAPSQSLENELATAPEPETMTYQKAAPDQATDNAQRDASEQSQEQAPQQAPDQSQPTSSTDDEVQHG